MDRKLLLLVLVFFLVMGSFTSYVFFRTSQREISAANKGEPCQEKSFLLVSPNQVKVGEKATINAVVRTCDETTLPEAQVCLISTLGNVEPACAPTNESGISDHALTSDVEGIAQISARINNTIDITTPVSVQFIQ